MGKQSRKKQNRRQLTDQLSTEEFQTGLARAAAWARLRASEEEAAKLATLITDHAFLRTQAPLRAIVQRDRETLIREGAALCAQMDWHFLLIVMEGYFAIETAQREFLPGVRCITERSRCELLTTWLIVRARQHGQDPAAILRLLNAYDVLGPHALRRVWVDAHRRLGTRCPDCSRNSV